MRGSLPYRRDREFAPNFRGARSRVYSPLYRDPHAGAPTYRMVLLAAATLLPPPKNCVLQRPEVRASTPAR